MGVGTVKGKLWGCECVRGGKHMVRVGLSLIGWPDKSLGGGIIDNQDN